ncbi:MAG: siphovirus Gp157 family protein [Clostridia bacterium]|nr:siphovirus Gp157 family protein [Clostridia bacterium]
MSMTLYQIKDTYLYFLQRVETGEVPEEAINDTLESIEGEFQDKADNVACFIKGLLAEAKAIKDEVDTLTERMKSKQAKADKLTDYLFTCMKGMNLNKLETTRNVLQLKLNPPSVEVLDGFIDWAKANRDDLLTYKDPTPDKKAIKAAMTESAIPFCCLEQKERLVIK